MTGYQQENAICNQFSIQTYGQLFSNIYGACAMLILFTKSDQIDFPQFMEVCKQSNIQKGRCDFPLHSPYDQLCLVESELCAYIRESVQNGSMICAAWAPDGRYKTVLRLEKYMDGYLICGLETALQERKKGYAKSLIAAVLTSFPGCCFYSHISIRNIVSARVHIKCGFRKILDHAIFLDGSISAATATYFYKT